MVAWPGAHNHRSVRGWATNSIGNHHFLISDLPILILKGVGREISRREGEGRTLATEFDQPAAVVSPLLQIRATWVVVFRLLGHTRRISEGRSLHMSRLVPINSVNIFIRALFEHHWD
jgi:hypothetical protein